MSTPATSSDLTWLRAPGEPRLTLSWSLSDWDRAVRLLRRHRLLARLSNAIDAAGIAQSVPPVVRRHLVAAATLSRARTTAMTWAIERLPLMLDSPTFPLVLLKGAAYVGQGLPIAQGRLPSDLDILVPKTKLPEIQLRLQFSGWQAPAMDEHDRRYYLEWSHELPPLRHARHAIELDVHHNILPPRDGRMIDASLLLDRLMPSRWPAWRVLAPEDQLLHSAAHLFFDAEPRDRVRDLVDMDGLFRHFGADPAFWVALPQRAIELGLVEPLALACHFVKVWLDTPLPSALLSQAEIALATRSSRRWLVPLMATVLRPAEPDAVDPIAKQLAMTLTLARYHWHRLPVPVLLPHLWRKWRVRTATALGVGAR